MALHNPRALLPKFGAGFQGEENDYAPQRRISEFVFTFTYCVFATFVVRSLPSLGLCASSSTISNWDSVNPKVPHPRPPLPCCRDVRGMLNCTMFSNKSTKSVLIYYSLVMHHSLLDWVFTGFQTKLPLCYPKTELNRKWLGLYYNH